jgi:hypothetical protein
MCYLDTLGPQLAPKQCLIARSECTLHQAASTPTFDQAWGFKRRVTRVAQNTRYYLTVKQQYVQYINEQIKIGRYRPQDIVSIDEPNFDCDQVSGETLANRGDKTIGCAVTGSANC